MTFSEAIAVIADILSDVGTTINPSEYDGVIVKALSASNTLDDSRGTTNQTHIAITGSQIDMFPYFRANGYFETEYEEMDGGLKKNYVLTVAVYLDSKNISYLANGEESDIFFGDLSAKKSHMSILRSRRKDARDQIELGHLTYSSDDFLRFRKLIHTGDYLVLLKRKEKFIFEGFGIKASENEDIINKLSSINNKFFRDATSTVVDMEMLDISEVEGEHRIKHKNPISEEDFRDWLSTRVIKKDGQLLSETYQNAYYYILKAVPSMLGFESVFSITDPASFERYRQRIELSKRYQEANPNVGVGTLSAALTNYGKYLDERHMINIPPERLGQLLKDWYEKKYVENNITSTLVGFGFKYARAINNAKITSKTLLDLAKIESTMAAYIDRGKDLYVAIEKGEIGFSMETQKYQGANILFDYSLTKGTAVNKIFFGTPGCGKSYHIEHDILGKDTATKEYKGDFLEENIIRTTFYQDYSNTDFVGQILPKIVKGAVGEKETVEYIFNPGPFTIALIQAISNPTKKVALVIEEINRGNAPAIFGDIFQLLDRGNDGISEYGIKNVGVIDYLNDYEFVVDDQKKRYRFSEIKIPGNLYIYATMNTSDQNVYTLDTAFVRRWDREKIKNTFKECSFKETKVPGMGCSWQEFVESINACIASHLEDLQVNEDKQIGAFFVKESLLVTGDAAKFAYKVFDYLWNDVAKLDHGIFFNHYDTLDALIAAYINKGADVFKPGIFKEKAETMIQNEDNNE